MALANLRLINIIIILKALGQCKWTITISSKIVFYSVFMLVLWLRFIFPNKLNLQNHKLTETSEHNRFLVISGAGSSTAELLKYLVIHRKNTF